MSEYKTVAETNNYIVLDKYVNKDKTETSYQTEADLERELIVDLTAQGYEYVKNLTSTKAMLDNIKIQLESLNKVKFSLPEWERFCNEYLDKPSDSHEDKTNKIHNDFIYDFVFDDGHIQNIYLVDKKNITNNKLQVISQFEQEGTHINRYDVTILVNGLPLVQVELKKRGVAIREAFNQLNRYSKESFNSENSLFKYLQVCVISNGTDSRYFANTTSRNKNSFDFTMNWAKSDNSLIKDLKDFTATFFNRNTLLNILLHYSVYDSSGKLLIMRPYQIAATERILWKIKSSHERKSWKAPENGGFIWHTTGSGKTLTSFKAALLATELDFVEKVFFVVDRKDLDYQTMKEYQKFSKESVNGSENTAGLRRNIESDDNRIIVTTIQKLNNLIKGEEVLPVYNKEVVFIFDEAHRSQFGEAQKNIKKKFKKYHQFGFTGTPIFSDNASGSEITSSVFGHELHSYVITDAIRDEKVLKFKVDYNDVRPKFKHLETEIDEEKLSSVDMKRALLHHDRIEEISQYILNNFRVKTHRMYPGAKGFNAMFAVSSVDAAKIYYETLNKLQLNSEKPLKIATIFSFTANEEQYSKGDIEDESFETTALDSSAKEFLSKAINDYNKMFGTSYSVDGNEFQNYYKDLAKKVKDKEVDLLIVVGMFLTGFDAPTLNTLFVDKNLRYHGLMQAFSRTNRIYDATKTFGNIVTFRDLEKATVDAITVFGNSNTRDVVLEKSYKEYIEGFEDVINGESKRGYKEVVEELQSNFAHIENIVTEKEKKKFVKVFGEFLRLENILQNYDEFLTLKDFKKIDSTDNEAVEEFKLKHYVDDKTIESMKNIPVLEDRENQDYRSTYNDIRVGNPRVKPVEGDPEIDWNDVVFEVDLLKSQEINLDYILELIFEKNNSVIDKEEFINEIRRLIRSSTGNRAKEDLVIDFINKSDLDNYKDKASVIDGFFLFAQQEQIREANVLILEEELNEEAAKRYITNSLRKEFASENGTELKETLPKMSVLNPQYKIKKQRVFEKISSFVDKFKGVGGKL